MSAIEFNHVWEKYRIKFVRAGKVSWAEVCALEEVCLKIDKGEILGVIGPNGAGKTTLLKLIAGMLVADRGEVDVEGKVSALMELGAGFNLEFTGRENIALNARLYGLDEKTLNTRMDRIIAFAGLGKFIDAPIRYYSQGMYLRLAFALAIFVEPDILLIDDILAVGDENTQRKCLKKIAELKEAEKTIILVSHNMQMVSRLCNRAILLEKGKIIQEGLPAKVIPYYLKTAKEKRGTAVSLEQQAEEAQPPAQRSISSGNLRLFADLETKSLRIYYKEEEITKAGGLYSTFNVSKQMFWFLLNEAQWQIQKISERKMILTLFYEFIPLSQTWTLVCKDENSLEIKIEVEVNKSIFFTHQKVELELQDKYKNWITVDERGDFLVTHYIDDLGPVRLKDNRVSQVVLVPEDKAVYPQLCFSASAHLDKRIIGIYRRNELNEQSICLSSSLIISKAEGLFEPGKYIYFEGKIILGKEVALEEKPVLQGVAELKKDSLRFVFDRGRGRIFWKDRELTAGLGVYSLVRSSGLWYDSYQAVWQADKKDASRITASGNWPHIPISQIWQFELINGNLISWRVDIEIDDEIDLEIEQANIMLSSEYKNWIIPGINQGEFLDEYSRDYDLSPFRFWYGKTKAIRAKAARLPKILFKRDTKDEHLRAVVENTDNTYQARRILYQKADNRKLLPGKYPYFKGLIEIEPSTTLPKL